MARSSICFFYGDDDFLIEQEISMRSKGAKAERLGLDECGARQLMHEVLTASLFSAERILVLSGYEEENYQKVFDCIADIPPGISIIIVEEKVDKRTKFFKALQAKAEVKEFKTFAEWETDKIISWITNKALEHEKYIGQPAAACLNDISGPSLRQLSGEIEKLALYAHGRKTITEEDVKKLAVSGELAAFAIENAVAGRDLSGALAALASMFRAKERADMILGRIYSRLRLYLMIKSLKQAGFSKSEAVKRMNMNPYYFERCEKGSAKYSLKELVSAVLKFSTADLEMKTTGRNNELVMQLLLVDVMAGDRA